MINTDNSISLTNIVGILIFCTLIMMSMLFGSDMKEHAKIRKIVQNIEKTDQVIGKFKDKYGVYPGDLSDKRAREYFSDMGRLVESKGNENGKIDFSLNDDYHIKSAKFEGEVKAFWNHLFLSRMIDNFFEEIEINHEDKLVTGGFTEPFEKGGNIGILPFTNNKNKLSWHIGYQNLNEKEINLKDSLLPREAYFIDIKLDDGDPLDGKVVYFKGSSKKCLDQSEKIKRYNIDEDDTLCQIEIMRD